MVRARPAWRRPPTTPGRTRSRTGSRGTARCRWRRRTMCSRSPATTSRSGAATSPPPPLRLTRPRMSRVDRQAARRPRSRGLAHRFRPVRALGRADLRQLLRNAALRAFARAQHDYFSVIGNITPFVLGSVLRSRDFRPFYRVRLPAQSRAEAQAVQPPASPRRRLRGAADRAHARHAVVELEMAVSSARGRVAGCDARPRRR